MIYPVDSAIQPLNNRGLAKIFLSGYFVSNSKAALKKVEFGALTEKNEVTFII